MPRARAAPSAPKTRTIVSPRAKRRVSRVQAERERRAQGERSRQLQDGVDARVERDVLGQIDPDHECARCREERHHQPK